MTNNQRYHIGIDGGTKTGFAIWDHKEKMLIAVATMSFWEVYKYLKLKKEEDDKDGVLVWVEDPSQNKPVFPRGVTNKRIQMNIAQKVGMVKRETEILIEGIERLGFKVRRVQPQKGSYTKMKADAFNKMTGWQGRTSEHARDAAMLVFQR